MVHRLWIDLIPSVSADLPSRKTFLAVWCHRQQGSLCVWPDEPLQSPILHMAPNRKQDPDAVMWKQVAELIPVDDSMHGSWNEKSMPCQSLQKAARNDKVTCQNVLKMPLSTKEKEPVASCLWVSKAPLDHLLYYLINRQTDICMSICLYNNR